VKKTSKNTSMDMAMGMCLGVSIGTSIGTVFDNISMGSSMGLIIGMLIGLVIGAVKDEKVNKQMKEKGYTILSIKSNESNEEYIIVIVNKAGEESVINVPKGQMEAEDFQIGDVVYLDDDGMIEQAFDKKDE
jgi:outer membrane lipoprotein SlyB